MRAPGPGTRYRYESCQTCLRRPCLAFAPRALHTAPAPISRCETNIKSLASVRLLSASSGRQAPKAPPPECGGGAESQAAPLFEGERLVRRLQAAKRGAATGRLV